MTYVAATERKVTLTWAPLQPRRSKEYSLALMFGYTTGRYLMARVTSTPDVEDAVDGLHARSCRTSRQRQGEGGQPQPGPWSSPARDQR